MKKILLEWLTIVDILIIVILFLLIETISQLQSAYVIGFLQEINGYLQAKDYSKLQ
jgi:hypothetical protein